MTTTASVVSLDSPPIESGQSMEVPRALEWKVPRWIIAHQLRSVARTIFGPVPMLRIVGTSMLVGAAIWLAVKMAIPQLQFAMADVWLALLSISEVFAMLSSIILLQLVYPITVKLTDESIEIIGDDRTWCANASEIESAKLVVLSSEHLMLTLKATNRRDGERSLAIPPTVDLYLLTSILSGIEVIDKRAEFVAAREIVQASRRT